MEDIASVLLLRAVQAWCEDCGSERLLMPDDDAATDGWCCTVCDAAVFLVPAAECDPGGTPLRRTA